MIGIVDYGMGNLRSVQKAFEYLGYEAVILDDPAQMDQADHLVLPGVGAFRDAMARLKEKGFDQAVKAYAASGKPLLGICLGMQLMFEKSYEDGEFEGLGLFPGAITRIEAQPGLKIPHMGWNTLQTRVCPLFAEEETPCVYFVHSYQAAEISEEWTAAVCDYGKPFSAAVCRGNVMATQFHPEKSGDAGLAMLRRFAEYQGVTAC